MKQEGANLATVDSDGACEELASIVRSPRVSAAFSGVVALAAIVALISSEKVVAGLLAVLAGAVTIFLMSVHQIRNFSPAVISRLRRFAEQIGGSFTLRKAGTGGHSAVPFDDDLTRDRFAVINYVEQGRPIEVGHLLGRVHAGYSLLQRIDAYVLIRLPRRMPHMAIDFGHLSRVAGVRIMPVAWHGSQQLDVGGGRRFRLFVADGGEQIARAFFTPEVVEVLRAVGRSYDVEVKGDSLYLFSKRSMASGSERRLRQHRRCIDDLTRAVARSGIWDLPRRQNRGRNSGGGELSVDVKRGVIIVGSVILAVIVVLSALAIYMWDQGLWKV